MALGIPKSIGSCRAGRARVTQPVALLIAPGSKEHPAQASEHLLPLTRFTAKLFISQTNRNWLLCLKGVYVLHNLFEVLSCLHQAQE